MFNIAAKEALPTKLGNIDLDELTLSKPDRTVLNSWDLLPDAGSDGRYPLILERNPSGNL